VKVEVGYSLYKYIVYKKIKKFLRQIIIITLIVKKCLIKIFNISQNNLINRKIEKLILSKV